MTDDDPTRNLEWPHGRAQMQRLAGMLAPVVFRAPGRPDFSPLHIAPWSDETHPAPLPGILQRLRGEWPCVPFGRTDLPAGLPPDWRTAAPADEWVHGYAAHHPWTWLPGTGAAALGLTIACPADSAIRRLTRVVSAVADAPALDILLRIEARTRRTLPVALHPTLRLDLGRVELELAHAGPGLTYPLREAGDGSRLAPDCVFSDLRRVPRADGGTLDLARYPQPADGEELVQLCAIEGPVGVNYIDQGWRVELTWDLALLPDAMLWISHRGRRHAPWNGRHLALGIEPVNAAFDLGRVAVAPAGHPLAQRGIAFDPETPCQIRYRIAARPL